MVIRKEKEIDKAPNKQYIWYACENCGKERWVRFIKGQPVSKLILSFASIYASFSTSLKLYTNTQGLLSQRYLGLIESHKSANALTSNLSIHIIYLLK